MPCPSKSPKLFWMRPNCFGPVQNVLDLSDNNFSLIISHFEPYPKQFGRVKNNLDRSKIVLDL